MLNGLNRKSTPGYDNGVTARDVLYVQDVMIPIIPILIHKKADPNNVNKYIGPLL